MQHIIPIWYFLLRNNRHKSDMLTGTPGRNQYVSYGEGKVYCIDFSSSQHSARPPRVLADGIRGSILAALVSEIDGFSQYCCDSFSFL